MSETYKAAPPPTLASLIRGIPVGHARDFPLGDAGAQTIRSTIHRLQSKGAARYQSKTDGDLIRVWRIA